MAKKIAISIWIVTAQNELGFLVFTQPYINNFNR